ASVLQVVPPAALDAHLLEQEVGKSAAAAPPEPAPPELIKYIGGQVENLRNHRNTASGWSNRLTAAMEAFNGQYSEAKKQEVKRCAGSQVYARLTAQKCRAASSLLRDIYLGTARPWSIQPPADPD